MLLCTSRRSVLAHASTLCGGTFASLYERRSVCGFSNSVTDLIAELCYSFFGIVQAGYRSLLGRTAKESEPTCIDVQGSESDSIPSRPRTPRTFSRVSSFNKSFSVGPGSGEDTSPFLNQFTTVRRGYGKSLASPTKIFAPRPVSAQVATLGLGKEQTEEHANEVYSALQAPTSPTRAKSGAKHVLEPLAESDEGINNLQETSKAGPSMVLRTSKRLRNEESRAKEESGVSTPSKRRKV
jgi:hypothetical protein